MRYKEDYPCFKLMKKILILIVVALFIFSCNRKFDTAMKSADKNLILKTANEYFEKEKWQQAISLYERLPNLVAGTDDSKTVIFNTAYANYYDKQYRVAGHHFKNFSVTFPDDPRAEEASYMSALCYYEGSYDYNLDQANTQSALNELQNFLNNYPNSERGKNINKLIDELSYKQEFKAYEHARQYYNMEEYVSAIVSFENFLQDFPATKLRTKVYNFLMKSKYELAMNSRFSKKEERLNSAISYTKFLEKESPNTELSSVALEYRPKLEGEKIKHLKLMADIEAENKVLAEKQKKLADEEASKSKIKEDKKRKARKIMVETRDENQRALSDSAKAVTPKPAATFKIPRN